MSYLVTVTFDLSRVTAPRVPCSRVYASVPALMALRVTRSMIAAQANSRKLFVVEQLRYQYPPKGTLRFNIRTASIALEPARGDIVRCFHRLPGIDGAPNRPTARRSE